MYPGIFLCAHNMPPAFECIFEALQPQKEIFLNQGTTSISDWSHKNFQKLISIKNQMVQLIQTLF
jgi:hypothetical protein